MRVIFGLKYEVSRKRLRGLGDAFDKQFRNFLELLSLKKIEEGDNASSPEY